MYIPFFSSGKCAKVEFQHQQTQPQLQLKRFVKRMDSYISNSNINFLIGHLYKKNIQVGSTNIPQCEIFIKRKMDSDLIFLQTT